MTELPANALKPFFRAYVYPASVYREIADWFIALEPNNCPKCDVKFESVQHNEHSFVLPTCSQCGWEEWPF